jgi:hypothetical protein
MNEQLRRRKLPAFEDNPNFYNLAAKKVFDRYLAEGADPIEIIQDARAYTAEITGTGATSMPFEAWLLDKPWERRRQ